MFADAEEMYIYIDGIRGMDNAGIREWVILFHALQYPHCSREGIFADSIIEILMTAPPPYAPQVPTTLFLPHSQNGDKYVPRLLYITVNI